MENFDKWLTESRLVESATSAQTVTRLKNNLTKSGHELNKHINRGEHGIHVIYHSTKGGDRYRSTVKGDTITTRPARAMEATHFAAKPGA